MGAVASPAKALWPTANEKERERREKREAVLRGSAR